MMAKGLGSHHDEDILSNLGSWKIKAHGGEEVVVVFRWFCPLDGRGRMFQEKEGLDERKTEERRKREREKREERTDAV